MLLNWLGLKLLFQMDRIKIKISKNPYPVKSLKFVLKDIDIRTRSVSGYFNSFDEYDSDEDIIRKGTFLKSILENGPQSKSDRIAHLRYHDTEHQIGNIKELYEDDFGLFFRSEMGTSTKGDDAFKDYQEGIIKEHSIGFQYISDKIEWIDDVRYEGGGYYNITEVKLWEGSAVTWGSNALTPPVDISKSINGVDNLKTEKIKEITETILNSLRIGKGSDERLINLEMQLKQVQQLAISLEDQKPHVKSTSEPEPKVSKWNETFKLI